MVNDDIEKYLDRKSLIESANRKNKAIEAIQSGKCSIVIHESVESEEMVKLTQELAKLIELMPLNTDAEPGTPEGAIAAAVKNHAEIVKAAIVAGVIDTIVEHRTVWIRVPGLRIEEAKALCGVLDNAQRAVYRAVREAATARLEAEADETSRAATQAATEIADALLMLQGLGVFKTIDQS